MLRFEWMSIIGWWVALFLALWLAIYIYGRNAAHATFRQLLGRVGGGAALLAGLAVFFLGCVHEMLACDCAHGWWHVVGSLSATTLIAGPVMLLTARLHPAKVGRRVS